MDYWPTLKPPEESRSQSPSDGSDWRVLTDAARGERRLRVDGAGRPVAWQDATGTRLDFAHDSDGNLRRISCGEWSLAIDGPAPDRTLRGANSGGATDLLLAKAGRVRTLTRGGDRLSIELDSLERVRRVALPGSVNALTYDWDEHGGCIVRPEDGGPLLTLSEQGTARRIALDPATYWEEEVLPVRVRLRATIGGTVRETIELRLTGFSAIAERRWSDGSGDLFERDERGRLSTWIRFDEKGVGERRNWLYSGDDLVEDVHGRRMLGEGGRVLALDRPGGGRIEYRYDAAGRRIARVEGGRETGYAYDPLGTLARIRTADGIETELESDGMGRRVALRRDGAAARHEHRDEAGRLWAVTDDRGRALHTYVWIGDRIAARIDGAIGEPLVEAYLCDPLGTPNGVFIADGDDWRFERLDAPPFGRADNEARPTLFSHFGDPVTGLIHCGAREIDPELGLFLTPDPWHGGEDDPRRLAGMPAALIERERERPVAGFHDYALCRFDPLGRYDRDGHASGGDIVLHVLRWILLPTWGFPMTSVSVYFFQPVNLYMEIVGLLIWAIKGLFCEDKRYPWGNNTIAKATGLLGSSRQFTFALGLNGFLPRVVTGQSLKVGRAVTVGNVIWIARDELDMLERAEVVAVNDIGGGAAGAKFNDNPATRSVVALLATDKEGAQRLHVSAWTRGLGNKVVDRAGVQVFTDDPHVGAIHLRHPVPLDTPVPKEAKAKEKLEVHEFVAAAPPVTADLETVAEVWFALKLPKDTGFAKDEWLRVTAPKASGAKPDAAFRRIRELLPAVDHVALILTEPLPPRFQTAHLSTGLKLEGAKPAGGASASGGWTAPPGAKTLSRTVVAGPSPADFPPDLAADSVVRIVAATPAAAPVLAGLPPSPAEDTRFTAVKALRARLTLAPDTAGVAVGAALRRLGPDGPLFHGIVEKAAQSGKIKLTVPHPAIAKDDLLVISRGGGAPAYVRAKAAPAGGVLTVDPVLPAALVPADATPVDLQRTADSGADAGGATVTAVAGSGVDVSVPRGRFFLIGNLVRLDIAGVPALRRIDAIPQMEIDVVDEPVGTGALTLTRVAIAADRVREGVELAPPGRFLKWTAGAPLATLGTWPNNLLAIEIAGMAPRVGTETAAHYLRPAVAGRPAGFASDFHHFWNLATEGADQYAVLEAPLPIVRRVGDPKSYWRTEADDHSGDADIDLGVLPATPFKLSAVGLARGAVRGAPGTTRVLAHEAELLVPDNPTIHDTHYRALVEHEIHHTVQANFWGPLMGALPLQGLTMSVVDLVAAGGGDIPEWLQQVQRDADGNPPEKAPGRIDGNTEINPFQWLSIAGFMQGLWKLAFLAPFRASPELFDKVTDWDFEDLNKFANPVSRLVTQKLDQIDPNAPAGDRWPDFLGQMLSKALDLRSWTPFLGFYPALLPDGPTNFIEQGASRASGDLYSTILTVNDRYNLLAKGRLFGSRRDSSADIHAGLGRPVRMLMFCGYRTDRVLQGSGADAAGATITYRENFQLLEPFKITLPDAGQTALFQDSLYKVDPPSPPVLIEGPGRVQKAFVRASAGDTVTPKLRALVPMPPRVNRSLGFYLIAASPGRYTVAAPPANEAGTETATVTIEDEVRLGDELVAWSEPAIVGALPAGPPALKRYQTEESELRFRQPKSPKGGAFVDAGTSEFVLDIPEGSVARAELPTKLGWTVTMPVALPATPVRIRLYRIVKKDDPAFDLAFSDEPTLAGIRSYLDTDTFVVIRDVLLAVEALPELPAVAKPYSEPVELALPIRLVAGARGIVITPPAGVAAPPVTRIGDDGRGEKWKIGPLAEPLGEEAVFQVKVTYGRPGRSLDKTFQLTLTPGIRVTAASYDMRPGLPLELDVAGGTPPYNVVLAPALPGLAATQPVAGKIRLLATTAPDAVTDVTVTVTDNANPPARGVRHVSLKHMPPILAPDASNDYLQYVRPATLGLAKGLINGRSSGGAGPNVDLAEAIDAMERAVTALGAGDSVYLSAWYFSPTTPLRVGGIAGVANWGALLAKKARDGVRIRLLINDFDAVTSMHASLQVWLGQLDALITALPADTRDNLKYVVSLHPAHIGKLKARLAGLPDRNVYVASHHQKFMLVRKGSEMTAFCGGIDIETMRTPATWNDAGGLSGWHDIHVQLEGPITRDLEGEFVARWNRERGASTRTPVAGWAAMEELTPTALSPADDVPAKKPHLMQMLRTVSVDGSIGPYETKRDDIKQAYRRAIRGATRFLYLENQYFRSIELGEWIAQAGTANPGLIVIMVVVAFAERDDGPGAMTQHGNYLQFETLSRIATALGPRAGFYTMANRLVHSKFMLVDDDWMTIGSANANGRSFELDTELNLQISDATLARDFRTRLWAHNLGKNQADVSAWAVGDFLGQWNSVAAANGGIAVPAMAGEGIVSFDPRGVPGRRHDLIPDALVHLDFGTGGAATGDRVA